MKSILLFFIIATMCASPTSRYEDTVREKANEFAGEYRVWAVLKMSLVDVSGQRPKKEVQAWKRLEKRWEALKLAVGE